MGAFMRFRLNHGVRVRESLLVSAVVVVVVVFYIYIYIYQDCIYGRCAVRCVA